MQESSMFCDILEEMNAKKLKTRRGSAVLYSQTLHAIYRSYKYDIVTHLFLRGGKLVAGSRGRELEPKSIA